MKKDHRRRKGTTRKAAGFIIRKLAGNRAQPFLVDIRRVGFVRRKTFTSLEAAEAYCRELRQELNGRGLAAFDLSDSQRLDAKVAFTLMGGRCSLEEAAQFWLRHHPDQSAVTYNQTLARYRQHLEAQNVRPATIKGLWRLDRIGRTFGDTALMAITADELAHWLDSRGLTPTNRNNYRRSLSAFFAYAATQGLVERNPVQRISVIKTEASPVVFWTAQQMATLLHTAEDLYPDLVPLFAIMAFAGLRPAEAESLRWESINFPDRIIRVEGATSKTRARRAVPITENLATWLAKYRRHAGSVAPKPQTLRRWRERIAAAVVLGDVKDRLERRKSLQGIEINKADGLSWDAIVKEAKARSSVLWPVDVLRHSYATHWLPVHKNEGELALAMGNSPAIIHRHYRGLVTEREAKSYWEIEPSTSHPAIPFPAQNSVTR